MTFDEELSSQECTRIARRKKKTTTSTRRSTILPDNNKQLMEDIVENTGSERSDSTIQVSDLPVF